MMENKSYVLVEEDVTFGHHIKLILQQAAREQWVGQVIVVPPVLGEVVVAFGPHEFRTSLASNGTALFANLPLDLLLAVNGPDLELWIV